MNVIETTDQRGLSDAKGGEFTITRAFKVTTEGGEGVGEIKSAVGFSIGDPGDDGTKVTSIKVQGTDSRYLYMVTVDFSKGEGGKNPLDEPDKFSWGFSGSSAPAVFALESPSDRVPMKPILNSAKDPLEGAMRDVAEARLTIDGNRASFSASQAIGYVNCVNSDYYSGGEPGTWKCMGITAATATATIDDPGGGEPTDLEYWTVGVELAYRGEGWQLKLMDVGYNELSGGKKYKISVPRIEVLEPNGSDAQKNLARQNFAAVDVQALVKDTGKAKPEGEPPGFLDFDIYTAVAFGGTFPEAP